MSAKRSEQSIKIRDLLEKSPGNLAVLCSHSAELSSLQKKLCAYLPSPLNKHLIVANFNDKTLNLHTDNAAWASRLRFKIPEILKFVQSKCGLLQLQTIRIRVTIPEYSNDAKNTYNPVLSEQTSLMIQEVARTISDNDLRTSLLRISGNKN